MRAFIRTSMAVLLAIFLVGVTLAQTADQAPPPQRGPHFSQRGFDRMAQQLNLTDQQKTQLQGIFQTQRQQAKAIHQDISLTPQQKQDKFKLLRESTHQQVSSVLTPEQQQQMKQMRQMRGPHEGKGGGMGPMGRLNLTPDQKSKVDPILQSQHQQVQAVRQDSSLTPEQKQAKVRDIRQNTMSQLKSLLTPEQLQQLETMRNRRGGKHGPPPAPPSGF